MPIPFTVTGYSVTGSGAFTDENAGVNKGHTVGPTTDTVALNPAEGNVAYYGLQFAGYTRAPGVHVRRAGQQGRLLGDWRNSDERSTSSHRSIQEMKHRKTGSNPMTEWLDAALA